MSCRGASVASNHFHWYPRARTTWSNGMQGDTQRTHTALPLPEQLLLHAIACRHKPNCSCQFPCYARLISHPPP